MPSLDLERCAVSESSASSLEHLFGEAGSQKIGVMHALTTHSQLPLSRIMSVGHSEVRQW